MFGNVQISQATGIQIPNIAANWPQLAYVMAEAGHMSDLEQIGMIATVAVETNVYVNHVSRGFYPIKELGGDIYFEKNYYTIGRCVAATIVFERHKNQCR